MPYTVKEIFYTLQGEGFNSGRAAVFLRFTGCNLWSGKEKDRSKAVCQFCDTDFVGGVKFPTASSLAQAVSKEWVGQFGDKFVVCTGGEPLLQLDEGLIDALHEEEFEVAVETNGTILAPEGIDWICVSPKAGAKMVQVRGNELKLVYPQENLMPDMIPDVWFDNFFLQPMDGKDSAKNTEASVKYCLENPSWRISLQTHKLLNIR
jgi:7-carboxy-7-deazaguanine synthase